MEHCECFWQNNSVWRSNHSDLRFVFDSEGNPLVPLRLGLDFSLLDCSRFHKVLTCLPPEHSPLDFCCTPCGSFFTRPHILWKCSLFAFLFVLSSGALLSRPRSRCFSEWFRDLLPHCLFFFFITFFLNFNDCPSVIGFHPVHFILFFEKLLCVPLLVFSQR